MADAGKIAPTYDGEWSADKTYDFHTYVTHNNNCYIAKQPSTGIEPTEEENAYWFLALKNVNANDIDNILNGTTTVGNANNADTVDGYHANQLRNTNPEGVPESSYLISQYVNNTNVFHIKSIDGIPTRVDKAIDSEQLGGKGASEYVRVSDYLGGSKVSVGVDKNKNIDVIYFEFSDGTRNLLKYDNTTKRLGFTEFDGSTWSGKDFAYTADLANYMPKSGGELTGRTGISAPDVTPLVINNTTANAVYSLITFYANSSHCGALGFNGANNPIFYGANGSIKTLLHTGNKPSGSYTGNGDATERWIETGGIGNALVIFADTTVGHVGMIVTPRGAFGQQGGQNVCLNATPALYSGGALRITTDSPCLNENGITYNYTVL